MKTLALVPVALLLAACSKSADAPNPPPPGSGIAIENFDESVKASDDFYRYVNGQWLAKTEIPADRSNYGAFTQLADTAEQQLRTLIERAAADPARTPGSDAQKVGDFYASFMDEARIEALGLTPLQPVFDRIDALTDEKEFPALLAYLDRVGVRTPLALSVDQDAKNSTQHIVQIFESGLGLPDRDYYLDADAKFRDIRKKYLAHVGAMLKLAGVPGHLQGAVDILDLELAMARMQYTKTQARDVERTYNKIEIAKLREYGRGFDWPAYLAAAGASDQAAVIVTHPDFLRGFNWLRRNLALDKWRVYFKWHALNTYAPYLSKAFVDENFAFYGQVLSGAPENRPRWKRGVDAVENGLGSVGNARGLGEILGRLYVDAHFPPENKARMDALVKNLIVAYGRGIDGLEWMGADTKRAAQAKLAKFTVKIGYPDRWRDYSKLEIAPDDLVGNVRRGQEFEYARGMAKLGRPVDRGAWAMTPQTVNAYYNEKLNEIVFPAAILQPPFFNVAAEDAVNYGGIGAVIGHEISHGFDDQGSKFDGDGNLREWWTADDRKNFEARAQKLVEQYDRYEPVKGFTLNGALTLGENIADLGGVTLAYRAYQLSRAGQPLPVIDGLTGDQRFFMGWAQAWRRLYREPELLNRLKTDPHSPSEYRANGVLVNLSEFHDAFGIGEGDRMYLPAEQRVKIW